MILATRDEAEAAIETIVRYIEERMENSERESRERPGINSYTEIFAGLRRCGRNTGLDLQRRGVRRHSAAKGHRVPQHLRAPSAALRTSPRGIHPVDRIIGISKLARLLDMHAKAPEPREDHEGNHGRPDGAPRAEGLRRDHLAPARVHGAGVSKQNSVMTTSSMRGAFFEKSEARAS